MPNKQESEAAAANFLFDLESGDKNAEVAAKLTANEIYTAVTENSTLSFTVNGVQYTVISYYPEISDDLALEILEDVRATIQGI